MNEVQTFVNQFLIEHGIKKSQEVSGREFIENFLSKNRCSIDHSAHEQSGYLSLYGLPAAYRSMLALYFHLRKLEDKRLIVLVQIRAAHLPLGKSNLNQALRIPPEVSSYLLTVAGSNIIVSPDFREYVLSGEMPPESRKVYGVNKKQLCVGKMTLIATLINFAIGIIFGIGGIK